MADALIAWVEKGGASGFILSGPVLVESLRDITRDVLPILAACGYWRPSDETTLRGRLGLPFKVNRYAEPVPELTEIQQD